MIPGLPTRRRQTVSNHLTTDSLGTAPFPVSEGAELLSGDGADALVYRFEDMAETAPANVALLKRASDFLGVRLSNMPQINAAATRRSFPRDQAAQESFRAPQPMLDAIYDDPIVSHFYSPAEIGAFKAKWVEGCE
jgi:hypothetical protein